MTLPRLIFASLRHHAWMHLAVALGVAVSAAVLCGALVVGDSMRGSLQEMTLARLGNVDAALVAPRFFRAELAGEIGSRLENSSPAADDRQKDLPLKILPAILLDVSVEQPGDRSPRRANHVNLIATTDAAALFPNAQPFNPPGRREIVLNRPLAEQLGVEVGGAVLLRLPKLGAIPAESALGRKQDTTTSVRLTVSEIIAAAGPGRFSLQPSQRVPLSAFVALDVLQEWLEQPGKVNAILAAHDVAGAELDVAALQADLQPTLADYGLKVEPNRLGYVAITSDQMILGPAVERQLLASLSGLAEEMGTGSEHVRGRNNSPANGEVPVPISSVQPTLTYLANTIACGDRAVPYSTVTAIDFAAAPPLGPMRTADGAAVPQLKDGEIALNSWAADDLQAKPGDTIRLTFFEPESLDGQVRERSAAFRLAAVVELSGAADDRGLTPTVPGVTDQLTMDDWDPPFPFDNRRIRPRDEKYWSDHGPTPKAFVSLAAGRKLWASRFGQSTSLRVATSDELDAAALAKRLVIDPASVGFVFQPVKAQGLAASAGTTPFEALFLGFSLFLIAAAVMLVALLFRLGVERRAAELGLLAAVGFSRRRSARILLGEGLAVAMLGGLLGVPLGLGYAWLMLLGLRTWWLPAVGTQQLALHPSPLGLAIGFAAGGVAALVAICWALWRTRKLAPRQLLAGQLETVEAVGGRTHWPLPVGAALLLAAVALGIASRGLGEEAAAGAFFGAGAFVLAGCLVLTAFALRRGAIGAAVAVGRGNLARLALRNAARHPGRSTLSMGLIAAAVFLIVAISAFRIDPSQMAVSRTSGNGGFALIAQSDRPIYFDLDTPQGRDDAGLSSPLPLAGEGVGVRDSSTAFHVYSLRVRAGDDASCLNLYQPRQPRVLGVPQAMVTRGGFAWAAAKDNVENPWNLLDDDIHRDADGVPLVPVILEKNTANYSLHLWQGVGQRFEIDDGRGSKVRLEIVALLGNSVFQGDLLIADAAFREVFPEVSGYRLFLIETPAENVASLRPMLENALGDYGLATQTTTERLAAFLAVQNTYLSTFQSLGGLGLLLGTLGLAAVQLRNVFERRGELALMRAAGFRRRTLALLVLLENGVVLAAGLTIGVLAAVVALMPHLLGRAGVPWQSLGLTLAVVFAVGLLAGALAARAVLRLPLLAALRREL